MASIFLSSRVCGGTEVGFGTKEEGEEALVHGALLCHRAQEVAIQQVNVCYTAKADLAECKEPSREKGVKVSPRFHNKTKQERKGQTGPRGNML